MKLHRSRLAVSLWWWLLLGRMNSKNHRFSLTSGGGVSMAQNLKPSTSNQKFDPDAGAATNTKSCEIPPFQTSKTVFRIRPGLCPDSNDNNATLDDAHDLASFYAPVLFFHPLEKYSLETVNATFADPSLGRVLFTTNNGDVAVLSKTLDLEMMLAASRNNESNTANNQKVFLEHERTPEYFAGAGFYSNDANTGNSIGKRQQLSRAPIYYNVFRSGNGTWTYNYWFYYTWSGPTDMAVASNLGFHQAVVEPYGQHEGDWESLTVVVCSQQRGPHDENENETTTSQPQQPLGISYGQHGQNQIVDCTKGECTFYKDTFHPVGFSAWNSHATYPVSARNILYYPTLQGGALLPSLRGFLIVDRTVYADQAGHYRLFMPNSTNVKRYYDPEDIQVGVTDPSLLWQGYTGGWGRDGNLPDAADLFEEAHNVFCINNEQLQFMDCPTEAEDVTFSLVMQVLSVFEPSDALRPIVEAVQADVADLLALLVGRSSTGPVAKSFFKSFSGPKNAGLWESSSTPPNATAQEICSVTIPVVVELPTTNTPMLMDPSTATMSESPIPSGAPAPTTTSKSGIQHFSFLVPLVCLPLVGDFALFG